MHVMRCGKTLPELAEAARSWLYRFDPQEGEKGIRAAPPRAFT